MEVLSWIYEHITVQKMAGICLMYYAWKYTNSMHRERDTESLMDMAFVFMCYCVIYMVNHP